MIGSILKEQLSLRGMRVGELSRIIDVPAQTLYSIIKRDNMKIDFDVLLRICRALDVPVELFCGEKAASAVPAGPDAAELEHLRRYRALDDHGRDMVNTVMDKELQRLEAGKNTAPRGRVIPLYFSPAAAGYASPALGEDYEDYIVPAESRADFAARISGDSMEPLLHDGDIALVRRCPIENGDIGLFFVDGDMKCKQYCRDSLGNVYLLSVNRARADADSFIPESSGVTVCCFGKVLLDRRHPLP